MNLPPKKSLSSQGQEFIEKRKADLDAYVQSMLATMGAANAFWNHPLVMNFFDIPIVPVKKEVAKDIPTR